MTEPAHPGLLRRLAPGALAIAVGVALAEVALQLAFWVAPGLEAVLEGRDPVPVGFADAELGFRPNPEHPEHDARGFRNPDALDRADVVTLGDSQSYGSGVAREAAWPGRLGGVAVYNMAFPGWGPAHGLLLLDAALALHPRVLIQAVYAGNDLYDGFQLVYGSGRLPELAARDRGVLRAVREAEAAGPLQAAARGRTPGDTGRRRGAWERARDASRIWGLARALRRELGARLESPGEAWARQRRHCERQPSQCVAFAAGDLRTVFTPARRLLALDAGDVRIAEGERIVLDALAALRERAALAGVELLVVLIPTKELAFAEGLGADPPSPGFRRLVELEAAFWARARAGLEARGIGYVDGLAALAGELAAGREAYRASSDGHPSELGHLALARRVAAALRERGVPGAAAR